MTGGQLLAAAVFGLVLVWAVVELVAMLRAEWASIIAAIDGRPRPPEDRL